MPRGGTAVPPLVVRESRFPFVVAGNSSPLEERARRRQYAQAQARGSRRGDYDELPRSGFDRDRQAGLSRGRRAALVSLAGSLVGVKPRGVLAMCPRGLPLPLSRAGALCGLRGL